MRALLLKKYYKNDASFIERQLPCLGSIIVKAGDKVKGFDKLGNCMHSEKSQEMPYEGVFVKNEGDEIFANEILWVKKKGFLKLKEGKAPFSGEVVSINEEKNTYVIQRRPREYNLIAGSPGVVKDVIKNRSVLLSSIALEVFGVAGKGKDVNGELVVVGGHDEELFELPESKALAGKIVVCGMLNPYVYSKGKFFGVAGFVAGSFAYSAFSENGEGPSILILEGFGKIPMSPLVFNFLKGVQSRFLVLRPGNRQVVIPEENKLDWAYIAKSPLVYTDIKAGQVIQIFSHKYYGYFGTVVGMHSDNVIVDVWGVEEKVHLDPANIGVVTPAN